ncbi:BTB/POZ domain-containing protein 19 [Macrotis lagotis]|uniref:BTB/POZ domain-containing protein 19 n=1 Tax=Macrotis lagotis TaxID=92651 RepID=UPI003D688456
MPRGWELGGGPGRGPPRRLPGPGPDPRPPRPERLRPRSRDPPPRGPLPTSSAASGGGPGPPPPMQGDPATFRAALRGLLTGARFSDVRFLVGQDRREVLAHRCLLTSRCDYFCQLFSENPGGGSPEEPIILADVPPEAFLMVLEFLYTNSITLDRRTVLEVLISALEYGLSELRELCVEFVVQNLDVELVCEALQVAVTFGLRRLRDSCLNFIESHTQAILRTPAFHELSPATLIAILRSDRLAVDEVELIAATRHWARVSSAVLEHSTAHVAQSVVGELRLPLLSPSELSALEEQNRVEPFIPVQQIAEAWKCHALRRGEALRGVQSRPRKGTAPREHHRYLEAAPKGPS